MLSLNKLGTAIKYTSSQLLTSAGFAVSDSMGQLPNIRMLGNVVHQQCLWHEASRLNERKHLRLVEFEAQKEGFTTETDIRPMRFDTGAVAISLWEPARI